MSLGLNALAVTNTPAVLTDNTPFAAGFNVVLANFSGGALTVQGSDNGTDYTTLASIEDNTFQTVTLPQHSVRVSTAATVYLLG